jgi:hypothetical protein
MKIISVALAGCLTLLHLAQFASAQTAKPLLKVPSVDVNKPLPIPILAQPQQDRASLADPTLGASLKAALKALTPTRLQPLPFMPFNLPDPFEHMRSGQLRNPPEENPMPPVIPLQRPTK